MAGGWRQSPLVYHAEQLRLQDELALLVFLTLLVGLVIFPADGLLAAPTDDVADDVTSSRHIPLDCFRCRDVDHVVEEVRFAMLATEVL